MAYTAEELVELVVARSPKQIIGIMQGQDGFEFIEASAAMFERVSKAVDAYRASLTAGRAEAGRYASGTVTITRTNSAAASLDAGAILQSRTGLRFTLLDSLSFATNELGPKVARVVARAKTTHGNLLSGEKLSVVYSPNPLEFDHTFEATAINIAGGKGPALEMMGGEKGLSIMPDESEQAFRKRFRELNQFASLPAVEALVRGFYPTGRVVEIFNEAFYADHSYTWDWPEVPYPFNGSMAVDVPANGFLILVPFPVETDGTWCYTDRDAYADRCYCGLENLTLMNLGDGGDNVLVDVGRGSDDAQVAALRAAIDKINNAGVWYVIIYSEVL